MKYLNASFRRNPMNVWYECRKHLSPPRLLIFFSPSLLEAFIGFSLLLKISEAARASLTLLQLFFAFSFLVRKYALKLYAGVFIFVVTKRAKKFSPGIGAHIGVDTLLPVDLKQACTSIPIRRTAKMLDLLHLHTRGLKLSRVQDFHV